MNNEQNFASLARHSSDDFSARGFTVTLPHSPVEQSNENNDTVFNWLGDENNGIPVPPLPKLTKPVKKDSPAPISCTMQGSFPSTFTVQENGDPTKLSIVGEKLASFFWNGCKV